MGFVPAASSRGITSALGGDAVGVLLTGTVVHVVPETSGSGPSPGPLTCRRVRRGSAADEGPVCEDRSFVCTKRGQDLNLRPLGHERDPRRFPGPIPS